MLFAKIDIWELVIKGYYDLILKKIWKDYLDEYLDDNFDEIDNINNVGLI